LLLDQPQELIRGYERLIRVDPGYDYARGCLLNTKLQCCDWRGFDESVAEVTNAVAAGKRADLPFTFLAISDSARDQLTCARTHVTHGYPAVPAVWQGQRYDHKRIRVAYLSSDLREHAVAHLAAGLFEAHDKTRFETVAVSFGPDAADGMRSRMLSAFSQFLDVRGKSDHAPETIARAYWRTVPRRYKLTTLVIRAPWAQNTWTTSSLIAW
jgi:predicted O-linked N-acetylglucosamine transferase (SPINDLY family)